MLFIPSAYRGRDFSRIDVEMLPTVCAEGLHTWHGVRILHQCRPAAPPQPQRRKIGSRSTHDMRTMHAPYSPAQGVTVYPPYHMPPHAMQRTQAHATPLPDAISRPRYTMPQAVYFIPYQLKRLKSLIAGVRFWGIRYYPHP